MQSLFLTGLKFWDGEQPTILLHRSTHLVLVVYLDDDDGRVGLDVLAPPVHQDLVEHEQLVPRGRQRLVYHLEQRRRSPRFTQASISYIALHSSSRPTGKGSFSENVLYRPLHAIQHSE